MYARDAPQLAGKRAGVQVARTRTSASSPAGGFACREEPARRGVHGVCAALQARGLPHRQLARGLLARGSRGSAAAPAPRRGAAAAGPRPRATTGAAQQAWSMLQACAQAAGSPNDAIYLSAFKGNKRTCATEGREATMPLEGPSAERREGPQAVRTTLVAGSTHTTSVHVTQQQGNSRPCRHTPSASSRARERVCPPLAHRAALWPACSAARVDRRRRRGVDPPGPPWRPWTAARGKTCWTSSSRASPSSTR
jgi:hypothetical protein